MLDKSTESGLRKARFVPFAIFVCSASMLIFIVLCVFLFGRGDHTLINVRSLAFSFLFRERNPISTRTELACLGLTGIFWLSELYQSLSEAFDDVYCSFGYLPGYFGLKGCRSRMLCC